MARNRERTGARQNVDPAPAAVLQDDSGGGFSFVVPTEFVELPSQGRYYPEGHPLHGLESVEIRQMTAKEEDILTSRTLLKKGLALDRAIESIIVDKRVKPNSIIVGDKNAIIVAMRVSGYGNEYETKVNCPACAKSQNYIFDLNEANVYAGDDLESLNIVDNQNGTFDVQLPRTGVNVTFRLLTGSDEKMLMTALQNERKKKGTEKTVTRQLANIIVAVNGDTSAGAINYLVSNIPSMDSRHLRLSYRLAAPDVDLTQHFECEDCGHEQDMEVPLTADFFWPDR